MEQEFSFQSVIEHANDVVVITRAHPLHEPGPIIVYVNEAFLRLTGYRRDEVIGKSPRMLQGDKTSPESRARIRAALEKQEPLSLEILNYGKDGREYWLDMNIVPLRDASGEVTHFAAIERDVTETRKLRAYRDQFFQLSAEMLCIADFNGHFRQINPAWELLLGYSAEELLSKPFVDFVHPDDQERTIAEAQRLQTGSETVSFENRYLARNGDVHWLLWSASADADQQLVYAVARDITERKNAETALAESEQRYRSVISGMAEGVVVQDESGFITSANESAEKILGLTCNQLKGRTSVDPRWRTMRADGSDYPGHEHPAMHTLRTGEPIRDAIMGVHKPDDSLTWISINTQPLFKPQGTQPYAVVSTFHDITATLRADQLKNEFLSTVSHELRTPLTSIRGALGLLESGKMAQLPDGVQTIIELASRNCDRLMFLINDLLDMEKISSGNMEFHFEPIKLADAVRAALEANQPYGARHIVRFETRTILDDIEVHADWQRLLQVLANLLSNAAKYSPQESVVEVFMEEVDRDRVRIGVSDQGPGIDPDFHDRIFQKFAQADSSDTRKIGGTGLGLAISKALVERHNGAIGFRDNEPTGTTFYFDLPLNS